jgi:hypothetical protein
MDTIKKMLVIFVVNTLVMLISWAGLSLVLLGVRLLIGQQGDFARLLSIHSYVAVMFFYAFYLIFDLCEFYSTAAQGKQ